MNPQKIIIGTELFSGSRDKKYYLKEVFTLLNGALKLGINQIDTAPSYGQNFSVEKMVGSAIKKNRNKFKLSTKFTNDIGISNSTKRLDAIKRKAFVKGYRASDEEALGLVVSKFTKFHAGSILAVATEALEDSNYDDLASKVDTIHANFVGDIV